VLFSTLFLLPIAGQSAEVDVDAYAGMKLHGTIQSFSGATGARFSLLPPENATGNFTKVVQRLPVRIPLDSIPEDRALRPGMSVEVTVATRKEPAGQLAPRRRWRRDAIAPTARAAKKPPAYLARSVSARGTEHPHPALFAPLELVSALAPPSPLPLPTPGPPEVGDVPPPVKPPRPASAPEIAPH
jgi:hypothetical protein